MKRYLICTFFVIFLLIVTSCYANPIMEYTPTIIDNGQYAEDLTCHIVSVDVPDGYEDIYYSTNNSSPTSNSSLYSPGTYEGSDSKFYEGILVKEGATIYVIGYKTEHGNAYSSFVSNLTIGVNKWDISIVDNGPCSEDKTKHIITIIDSSWNGSVYYNFGKYDNPTSDSLRYSEKNYVGRYGKEYCGILVPAGYTIRAISYKTIGNAIYSSNIVEKDLNQWEISIVDNGPALDNNDKRIVSIVDSTYSSNDIYYTLDGSTPTAVSTKYIPTEYLGADSQTYVGVLLPEATVVKAVAERANEDDMLISSFIAEMTTDINDWKINIVDYGASGEDSSKRVISVIDSKWDGTIYYTVNGNDPLTTSNGLMKYISTTQNDLNGDMFEGILVDEAITVKAYSRIEKNGKTKTSDAVEIVTDINKWEIQCVDYCQLAEDLTKSIVVINDEKWDGDVFYTIDGSTPTMKSLTYAPEKYLGSDAKEYEGIVVPAGSVVKAFSHTSHNGKEQDSFVFEKEIEIKEWHIIITDNGLTETEKNHIVSIADSVWNGDIYYTLDGTDPTVNSIRYAPGEHVGNDSQKYEGILIADGDIVKAISFVKKNTTQGVSYISKLYRLGDTGPAGGIVFYDKGDYRDNWRYLEAAPEDLENEREFGMYLVQTRWNGTVACSVGTYDAVGKGKYNTEVLADKTSNGSEYAAKACMQYSYNGYTDWFLPSKCELNYIYMNLVSKGIGNFEIDKNVNYWSSTESDGRYAWSQNFYGGKQEEFFRHSDCRVRPIRAY